MVLCLVLLIEVVSVCGLLFMFIVFVVLSLSVVIVRMFEL